MRKILCFAVVLLLAAVVSAQPVITNGGSSPAFAQCTVSVASGQSLSPVISTETRPAPAGSVCGPTEGARGGVTVQLQTPAALDAGSFALLLYSCTSDGVTCKPLQDMAGMALAIPLIGGASPSSNIQLDPAIMVSIRVFRFQVVNSSNVAVAQTANRVFTLMVRSLL